jgi:hypothetical protein
MNNEHGFWRIPALFVMLAGMAFGGCAGQDAAVAKTAPSRGGAQLWAESCNRCHNLRPPGEFSDAQWDVIVHHMRVRANLTAEEHRQILAFLKASN